MRRRDLLKLLPASAAAAAALAASPVSIQGIDTHKCRMDGRDGSVEMTASSAIGIALWDIESKRLAGRACCIAGNFANCGKPAVR